MGTIVVKEMGMNEPGTLVPAQGTIGFVPHFMRDRSLKDRLQWVLTRTPLSASAWSQKAGKSRQYVSKLIDRDASRPDAVAIAELAKVLLLRPDWLLYGDGLPFDLDYPDPSFNPDDVIRLPVFKDDIGVPPDRTFADRSPEFMDRAPSTTESSVPHMENALGFEDAFAEFMRRHPDTSAEKQQAIRGAARYMIRGVTQVEDLEAISQLANRFDQPGRLEAAWKRQAEEVAALRAELEAERAKAEAKPKKRSGGRARK